MQKGLLVALAGILLVLPAQTAQVTITIPDAAISDARAACQELRKQLRARDLTDPECAQIFTRIGTELFVKRVKRQEANAAAQTQFETELSSFQTNWPLPVTPAQCGDSTVDNEPGVYVETCDDGNTLDGDGCNGGCNTEDGWACTGEPSTCSTTCGDNIIAGTEQCDDGNTNSGDGCDATCQLEAPLEQN